MDEIICKRCLMFSVAGENLHQSIKEYVLSLDENIKVNDNLYKYRLSKCEQCDALINGLCKYCGCFVLARAAKINMNCPYPQNKKW